MKSGEARKQHALAATGARHAAEVLRAQAALLRRLLSRGTATVDDIRGDLRIEPGSDPRWLGAVASGLRAANLIRRDGYVETARPEAHGRPISRWVLVAPERARAWLERHAPEHLAAMAGQGKLF